MQPNAAETPPLEVETTPQPKASVIWLHGLGADGRDFADIVPALQSSAPLNARFVFPHAPFRPVSLNQGFVMRAWYDIALREGTFVQNREDIRASVGILDGLIRRETARGVEPENIVLAGFSQGGVVALHAGLSYSRPLAGILALSVPLPSVAVLLEEATPAGRDNPIFMAHGTDDPMVPFATARQAYIDMAAYGLKIEWHEYPMGHYVIPQEIENIARWLAAIL
jgi:phospholipase/carboxylesterase